MFTVDKPVIFAYHGYPSLIHRLTYRRGNHANIHVHGLREEGTTTTPFDMVVLNLLDRFHLFAAVVERVPQLLPFRQSARAFVEESLTAHSIYIREHGIDMPAILDWTWNPGDAKNAEGGSCLLRHRIWRRLLTRMHAGATDRPATTGRIRRVGR